MRLDGSSTFANDAGAVGGAGAGAVARAAAASSGDGVGTGAGAGAGASAGARIRKMASPGAESAFASAFNVAPASAGTQSSEELQTSWQWPRSLQFDSDYSAR